jgi:hypothetical protein
VENGFEIHFVPRPTSLPEHFACDFDYQYSSLLQELENRNHIKANHRTDCLSYGFNVNNKEAAALFHFLNE